MFTPTKAARTGILIAAAFLLAKSTAVIASPGYCTSSPSGTDLSLPDVKFTIGSTVYTPSDCYGLVDTGSSDVANNLAYLNNLSWQSFVNGVKDDTAGGSNSVTVGNILYTLTAGGTSGTGTDTFELFNLSWADANGPVAPNLPVLVDLVLQWNGGNNDAFYLFDNVLLPVSPSWASGQIEVRAMNNPENSDLGTSHLDAYFSDPGPPLITRKIDVPEPATILTLGVGLAALGWSRRRIS